MRMLLLLPAVLGLAACDQSPSAKSPDGVIEARINMAPVAANKAMTMMHERHEGMEKIGKLMKQLSRDVKADPLDVKSIRASAAGMNSMAQKSANWFPAGTGPELGKTGAKPEIWLKPQDFAAKLEAFQKSAAAFQSVAQGGNAGATRTALANLQNNCKACHDLYRKKMH